MQYRFRTFGARGVLTLRETAIVCETSNASGTWAAETPYRYIAPHPIKTQLISPGAVWLICIFAVVAVVCGFTLVSTILRDLSASFLLHASMAAACLTGIIGIVLTKRFGKVHWLIFPTTLSGHRVAYTKAGPDAAHYDEFTRELTARIEAARE